MALEIAPETPLAATSDQAPRSAAEGTYFCTMTR